MNDIALFLLVLSLTGILAQFGMWFATYIKLKRGKAEALEALAKQASIRSVLGSASFLPPVTVLKPLAGTDGELLENLRSFARQDYPQFELVFGVQNPGDPAIEVVRSLQDEFPQLAIRLVMTQDSLAGYNPKVNNLVGMIPEASFEYLVISDSNVRVAPDYLRTNIQHFRNPVVGVVTNLIRATGALSAGSVLEGLHMNTFVMGSVSLADILADRTVVVGKSIVTVHPGQAAAEAAVWAD